MSDQALIETLLDLHSRLTEKGIELILGGGFGLFLKQLDLMSQPELRTLLPIEAWPRPRSTSDLDVFFPLKVLVSLEDMQAAQAIIEEMKFEVVPKSEYWKFVIPSSEVKLDLLTGPIEESAKGKLKSDGRRARPKGDLQLHAHPVPEALDLSEHPDSVTLAGRDSDGRKYSASISIPSPFTYLMMKITAFGDQVNNPDKNQGRHHALDVYRIVAMLTEEQFEETRRQFAIHSASPEVKHVVDLVKEYFSSSSSVGILRMKEHPFYGENMNIPDFMQSLLELVGSKAAPA